MTVFLSSTGILVEESSESVQQKEACRSEGQTRITEWLYTIMESSYMYKSLILTEIKQCLSVITDMPFFVIRLKIMWYIRVSHMYVSVVIPLIISTHVVLLIN